MGSGSSKRPRGPLQSSSDICGEGCCTNTRPRGCTHSCQVPSHRGECPPCIQLVAHRCHCGSEEKLVECNKWNNSDERERAALLSCGLACYKTDSCGDGGCTNTRPHGCTHSCQVPSHRGECPPCIQLVAHRCHCGSEEKLVECNKWNTSDKRERVALLSCRLTCYKSGQPDTLEEDIWTLTDRSTSAERDTNCAESTTSLQRFRNGNGRNFFDKFPTPSLLAEAQSVFTSLNLPVPEENGIRSPFPTPSLKDTVFKLEDFKIIDNNAVKTDVQACFGKLSKLVAHLMEPTRSDVGRVRAIFRWIAAQDVNRLKLVGSEPSSTAAYYLARIKVNASGYTGLFKEMCRLANIPCVTISGYVKVLGKDLKNMSIAWSAVYVGKSWRLVDADGGSRHLSNFNSGEYELLDDGSGKKNPSKAVASTGHAEYRYEEFCFLTDPHQWIYSHWTQDQAWQLLARPVSFEEFRDMAYLRPRFFDLGFDIASHPRCVLAAENGTCVISLKLPKAGGRQFMYCLHRSVKSKNVKAIPKLHLDRYVFLETIRDESVVRARVNFPSTGQFKLELFCKDTSLDTNNFQGIYDYVIHCHEPSETPPEPFPPNSGREWGPGTDMQEAGITPVTHTSGVVETEDGEAELRFHMEKHMEFMHKFFRDDRGNTKYRMYVFHRFENDEVIFRVRIPEKGRYALNLYAKEAGEHGMFPNICNYMVEGDDVSDDPVPFPDAVSNGQVGANATSFKRLGMQADGSVAAGLFQVGESGELELKFKLSQPVLFSSLLQLQTTEGEKDLSEYCAHITEGDMVTFNLKFPEAGMYALSLFGKSPDTDAYASIYVALIEADYPHIGALPFPIMRGKKSYLVLEPKSGYLSTGVEVKFLAKIPEADSVALIDDKCTHLTKTGQGLWEGYLKTGNMERDVQLSASLTPESHLLSTLLTYKVVSRAKLEEMRKMQEHQFIIAQEKMAAKGKRKHEEIVTRQRKKQAVEVERKKQEEEELKKQEEERKKRAEQESKRQDKQEEDRKRREEERERKEEKDRIKIEAEEELKRLDEQENEAERQAAELEARLAKAESQADKVDMENQRKQAQEQRHKIAIQRLKAAMKNQVRYTLEAAIQDFKARGLEQKQGELAEAETLLDMLILRDELYSAMAEKNVNAMKDIISRIENKGFQAELQHDVSQARNKIRCIEKIAKLNIAILDMDSKLMTEIRGYNNPPEVVHQVMIASLLLLGKHEGLTRVWKKCQTFCNPTGQDGLKSQVTGFDVDQLHPEIAARADQIIKDLGVEQVRQGSAGAATFYIWCNGMINEALRRAEENGDNVQAASKARQKELFRAQATNKTPRK